MTVMDSTRELLVLLEDGEARIAELEASRHAPIAIVGMACRFPGASDTDAFWKLLVEGREAIRRVPSDRWDADALYDPDPNAVGRIYTRSGGFLDEVDRFDARFFGISPREAESLDPQHRLFLEVAVEALEDAGMPLDKLDGANIGVYLGIGSGDYLRLLGDLREREPYYGPGNAFSAAAGRLSYVLGLQGPSLAVDTACSSSLVTVHLAMQALRREECDAALAGGVNLILSPETTFYFCRMGAMARDGKCKTFDASADGYVRSEGCGVVVLKRLADALTAGDQILAVLRGSAVNQDGRSIGLTVPNGRAQEAVIAAALADARVRPEEVSFVETHGTGTSIGDPIEVNALRRVLRPPELRDRPLTLGAVKTNLGHLESAAGVAGLIKAALVLRHGVLPPVLNFVRPNPEIEWSAGDIRVPTEPRPWLEARRVAGVSAFGFAGTNAHVILEAPPQAGSAPIALPPPSSLLLALSARGDDARRDLGKAYLDLLDNGADPTSLCRAAARRRGHFSHRLAVVGPDADALRETLRGWLEGKAQDGGRLRAGAVPSGRGRIAFVLPGQGAQWAGMARDLLDQPVFGAAIDEADAALAPHLGESLRNHFAEGGEWREIDRVQPALFALQVALAALLRSWGVVPDLVVGHSMGEAAAAYIAGILSLDEAARIIAKRSRLLRRIAGQGAMLLTELPLAEAERRAARFRGALSPAVVNSRRSTVLAGDAAAIEELFSELAAESIFVRRVKVDVASHSPQVDPLLSLLRADLTDLTPRRGKLPMISTVTGAPADGESLDGGYWSRNLRRPVLFGAAIEEALHRGVDLFLELGPHPILTPAIEETILEAERETGRGPGASAAVCLRRDEKSEPCLLDATAALYAAGASIDWKAFFPGPLPSIGLPHYPWQRQRFWAAPAPSSTPRAAPADLTGPVGDGGGEIGRFYDRGAAYHEARLERGATASDEALGGYLTWGLLTERTQGFSWLLTVFRPDRSPARQALLVEGQLRLRRLLFQGVDGESLLRVFDFGCGYGSDLIDLARAHPGLVAEGYTVSQRQSQIGNARASAEGLGERVRLYHRDSAKSPFPGLYDLILGFEVSGLIADKEALFDNIAAHLAPGGRLVLAEVFAAGDSPVDLPELSTHSATFAQFSELMARRRLRLLSCTDVSGPIANCLHDEAFEANFAEISADPSVDRDLLRHVAMYPNVGRALDSGLMTYALLSAMHDPHATAAELLAHNRAIFSRPTSFEAAMQALDSSASANPRAADEHTPDALSDWIWRIEWRPTPLPAAAGPAGAVWLLVGGGVSERGTLADDLTEAGQTVLQASFGEQKRLGPSGAWTVRPCHPEDFAELVTVALEKSGSSLAGIVFLGGLGLPAAELAESRRHGVAAALHLLQAAVRAGLRTPPRLWFATAGVQRPCGDADCDPAGAPVWGMARTAAHEHPDLRPSLVDLPLTPEPGDYRALARMVCADSPETQIAIRGGASLAARLVRAGSLLAGQRPAALRRDAAYLITGGLGALGLAVAERLARQGAGVLVLTGRKAPTAEAARVLDAIAACGSEVIVRQADAADPGAMRALIEEIDVPERPLKGVVHAAGGLDDGILLQQTAHRFERLLRAKQDGAYVLDKVTAGLALDFFVLFSGLASVLGSPGQGNYAAANAALDAVARARCARGAAALSIAWAPWAEIGLVAGQANGLSERGVDSLSSETALAIFVRCLGLQAEELAVMRFDRRIWAQTYPALASAPFLGGLDAGETAFAAGRGPSEALRAQVLAEPPGWRRRSRLETHVSAILAQVLRLPANSVERGAPLKDLGFDSLMSLEARNRLERETGLKLPVTLIWKHPTVADLVDHLAERLAIPLDTPHPGESAMAAPTAGERGDAGLGGLLDALEGLSDDEARRRLRAGN